MLCDARHGAHLLVSRSGHGALHHLPMKRPLAFAAECVAGLAVATAGAVIASKVSAKFNRGNQAAERTAIAAERIADALTATTAPIGTVRPRPMKCLSIGGRWE